MEENAERSWGTGGGSFGWADCEYEVNPVGSASLYRLTSVKHEGKEVDLAVVLRLNADAKVIDELIAAKFDAYKANQKAPEEVEKLFRRRRIKKIPGADEVPELPDL